MVSYPTVSITWHSTSCARSTFIWHTALTHLNTDPYPTASLPNPGWINNNNTIIILSIARTRDSRAFFACARSRFRYTPEKRLEHTFTHMYLHTSTYTSIWSIHRVVSRVGYLDKDLSKCRLTWVSRFFSFSLLVFTLPQQFFLRSFGQCVFSALWFFMYPSWTKLLFCLCQSFWWIKMRITHMAFLIGPSNITQRADGLFRMSKKWWLSCAASLAFYTLVLCA